MRIHEPASLCLTKSDDDLMVYPRIFSTDVNHFICTISFPSPACDA
jgi:hypothetical protein